MLARLVATPLAIAALWCGMAKIVETPADLDFDPSVCMIYEGDDGICDGDCSRPRPPLYCPPEGGPHPDRIDDTTWCAGAARDVRLSNEPLIPPSVLRIPAELVPFSYRARAAR